MNQKFIEMRRQIANSSLGTALIEWLEEKANEYCDARNIKDGEDLKSAKHVGRVLDEIIQELKVADRPGQYDPNQYR